MIGRRSQDDAQSFEEAWGGHTPRDEHIADLVRFAESLCEAAAVEPSPAFRDSLRTQLMTEAETVLVPMPAEPSRAVAPPAPVAHAVRRRVAGLTAAVVASVGVIGLASSSASAVPGEMLYPVKRGIESVELALQRDDASRGELQLAQASERLVEARRLSGDGRSEDLVADALDDFSAQAESGSASLFRDFTATGEEASVETVNDFATAATVDLSELSAQLPPSAGDSFDAAARAVRDLATQASSLCVSCSEAELKSLVAAVADLSGTSPKSGSDAGKPSTSDRTEVGEAPKADKPRATAAAVTDKPVVVAPTTAAPTKKPSLRDVTDPLVGPLLGDEDQEGLVPGLLNGLLGGPRK